MHPLTWDVQRAWPPGSMMVVNCDIFNMYIACKLYAKQKQPGAVKRMLPSKVEYIL